MRRIVSPLRTALALAVALALAAPAIGAPVRSPGAATVTTIAEGLDTPWDIAFLPDGRALVTERPGRVRLVAPDGRLATAPAATVAVDDDGEGGLLGVAVDPAFSAQAPFVYLSATVGEEVQVQRWRLDGDRLTFDGRVLEDIPAPGVVHNSARVRFGPDGALHIGTGDTGFGPRAQDPASLNGKILRIPPGAHRGSVSSPERLALGLRHPQGLAWQPGSGRLMVTDHGASGFDGPSGDDELNVITAGANYGWPAVRGPAHGAYMAPALVWSTTIAPTSIAFVTQPGSAWTGDAIITALKGEQLRRLTFDGTRVTGDEPLLVGAHGRLRAVAEAPDGAVWVGTSNRDGRGDVRPGDDRILRIVPPAAPPVPATAPRAAPRRATGPAARRQAFRVTPRQLLINQRIAQAAVRRLRAVEARLDGRRPAPRRQRRASARPVEVSARQLLINQRISQGALRIHARLAARVSGVAVPRIAPAAGRPAGVRVRVTRRQVRINQRIGQAAVRRANALRAATSPAA